MATGGEGSSNMDNLAESGTSGRMPIPDSAYDNWDPMGDISKHFLNLVNFDPNDPLSAIYGTEKLKPEEIPCKFYKYDSKSETCGRRGCGFRHVKTKFAEPLVLREIILSNQIEEKTKAPIGIINAGIVVAAVDPGDFFIIPYSDWICACNLSFIGEEKEETYGWGTTYDVGSGKYGQSYESIPNSGVANLLRLFEDFRQFDRVQLLDKKLGAVSTNQVVAVELHSEGMKNKKEWYRAVAMEDVILGEQSEVTLRLVDYGTLITAPLSQLALLPSKLLRYPPLGYLCALNGVSPISHRWSRRARELFVEMVQGKHCVFELIRRSYPEDGIFEAEPNLVELSLPVGENYVNLSEKLISEGLGIGWNSFPTRPDILNGVTDSRVLGLFMTQRPSCRSKLNPKLPTETIEKQKSLLEERLMKWSIDRQRNNTGGCTHSPMDSHNIPFPSPSRLSGAWGRPIRLPSQPTGYDSRKLTEDFYPSHAHGSTPYSSQGGNYGQKPLRNNATPGSGLEPKQTNTKKKEKTKWKPFKL